ncbi:MAG: Prenylated Rab acceptor 1 [Sporothrix thermara]
MVVSGAGRGARGGEVGVLRPRHGYIRGGSDDDEEASSDDQDSLSESTSDDSSESDMSEPGEEERAVLDSAMARIRRAQVKGKAQVNLSKRELAALKRHKEREARALERRQRRKERTDRRIAVPIEHLETMSRSLTKLPTPGASGDDGSSNGGSPQRIPGSFQLEDRPDRQDRSDRQDRLEERQDRQGYPPVGYFPPPSAPSRALPSSSSQPVLGSSRTGQEYHRGDSPFTYSYLRGPSSARHVSDPASTANHVDPFKYMTAGTRAPTYPAGAASLSDKGASVRSPAAPPAPARGRRAPAKPETESSEEEGNSTASDNDDDDREEEVEQRGRTDNSRRPPVHNTRSRAKQIYDVSQPRRRNEIVIEAQHESASEPEPEPQRMPERSHSTKAKKSSHNSSSTNPRRKPTGASSSSSAPVLHSSRQRKRK